MLHVCEHGCLLNVIGSGLDSEEMWKAALPESPNKTTARQRTLKQPATSSSNTLKGARCSSSSIHVLVEGKG